MKTASKKKELEVDILQNRKGHNRYFSLPEKTAVNVQLESLKKEFELAEKSVVGEAIATHFNELATEYEKKENIERISPGELLVNFKGKELTLPLIDREELEGLALDGDFRAYKEKLQLKQLNILKETDENATLEDLWSLVNHSRLANISTHASVKELLPAPKEGKPGIVDANKAGARVKKRGIPAKLNPPDGIKQAMIPFAKNYGLSESLTEAMLLNLATNREYLHPRLDEIKPGQAVWLARDINYKPRWGRSTTDSLQPVVVTLYTEDELGQPPRSREVLKKQELRRLARITSEAYLQDGVFTTVDLKMLMNRSTLYISQLLDLYKEHYQMWLPTAGTILDAGRCLTHKREAIELALAGLNTKKIARRLFHTTEAIDRYLDQFEKVALLSYKYAVPQHTIAYTLNCGNSLVGEYLDIVKEHKNQLPDFDAIEQRIASTGTLHHGA